MIGHWSGTRAAATSEQLCFRRGHAASAASAAGRRQGGAPISTAVAQLAGLQCRHKTCFTRILLNTISPGTYQERIGLVAVHPTRRSTMIVKLLSAAVLALTLATSAVAQSNSSGSNSGSGSNDGTGATSGNTGGNSGTGSGTSVNPSDPSTTNSTNSTTKSGGMTDRCKIRQATTSTTTPRPARQHRMCRTVINEPAPQSVAGPVLRQRIER